MKKLILLSIGILMSMSMYGQCDCDVISSHSGTINTFSSNNGAPVVVTYSYDLCSDGSITITSFGSSNGYREFFFRLILSQAMSTHGSVTNLIFSATCWGNSNNDLPTVDGAVVLVSPFMPCNDGCCSIPSSWVLSGEYDQWLTVNEMQDCGSGCKSFCNW